MYVLQSNSDDRKPHICCFNTEEPDPHRCTGSDIMCEGGCHLCKHEALQSAAGEWLQRPGSPGGRKSLRRGQCRNTLRPGRTAATYPGHEILRGDLENNRLRFNQQSPLTHRTFNIHTSIEACNWLKVNILKRYEALKEEVKAWVKNVFFFLCLDLDPLSFCGSLLMPWRCWHNTVPC